MDSAGQNRSSMQIYFRSSEARLYALMCFSKVQEATIEMVKKQGIFSILIFL